MVTTMRPFHGSGHINSCTRASHTRAHACTQARTRGSWLGHDGSAPASSLAEGRGLGDAAAISRRVNYCQGSCGYAQFIASRKATQEFRIRLLNYEFLALTCRWYQKTIQLFDGQKKNYSSNIYFL